MKKEVINIDQYFTDFSTKQDRRIQYKDELTPKILDNAKKLIEIVNNFLNELGIEEGQVTSGWRPASLNGKITNAAKQSYHMLGLAVDILDNKNQDLAKLIASKPDLLRKYGLWLEDFNFTRGKNTNWIHLDLGQRQDRPSRQFKP